VVEFLLKLIFKRARGVKLAVRERSAGFFQLDETEMGR
jgi:hypothetical protein